jgi:hypothetical protein
MCTSATQKIAKRERDAIPLVLAKPHVVCPGPDHKRYKEEDMRIIDMEVILHHFYRTDPFPQDTPIVHDAHARLLEEKLIELNDDIPVINPCTKHWEVTERGRVFVNALMSVPLPVAAWKMPIPDERKQS